jgi:ABC-2 type transport system permease protein
MSKQYSQIKALLAVTKASFLAILKNPGALFFSLAFPLIFVWIFGSFGSDGISAFNIAIDAKSDTSSPLYAIIKNYPMLKLKHYKSAAEQKQDLEKGRLAAVFNLTTTTDSISNLPKFNLHITSTSASAPDLAQVIPMIENISTSLNKRLNPTQPNFVNITKEVYSVREYKQIDFVLPGQIGFSILFSTLFGIAFTFYNLREQLILKRFYASPINRLNILIGIGFSRLSFQLINVIVLVVVGKLMLGFTLAHGFLTFIQIVALSIFMLFTLMGVGLIFSSIVKADSTIPLLINLFALPQMLLGGTFFSISVFPSWMQFVCKLMPLTHFNMAMRKLSFEGLSLVDCWDNVGVIAIWMVVIYAIVYKVFRWE